MTIPAPQLCPIRLIRDLVVQPPLLALDESVTTAIATLQQSDTCHCVLTLGAENQPIGILTRGDILDLIVEQRNLADFSLKDVVKPPITFTVAAEVNLGDLQTIFTHHKISHLPLIDEQQAFIGLLTQNTLLDFLNTTYLTDRPQSDADFVEQAQLYNLLVESVPMGIFRTDAAGQCTFVNNRWSELTGLDLNGAQGDGWQKALHPDDGDRIATEWYESAAEKRAFDLEYRFLTAEGKVTWVRGRSIAAEHDEQGEVTGYVGSVVEITDRKNAENTLAMILEGTAAATGKDFFALLAAHLAEATGCTYILVNELQGDRLHSLAYWGKGNTQSNLDYAYSHTPCQFVLEQDIYQCVADIDLQFPEDATLLAMQAKSYVGVALKDIEGKAIGNICVFDTQPLDLVRAKKIRNILEVFAARAGAELLRKQTDEAMQRLNQTLEDQVAERTAELQKSQERLGLITDSVPGAIAYIDATERYQFVNYVYEEWFVCPQEDLVGRTVRDITGDEEYLEKYYDDIQQVLAGERVIYEGEITYPNGQSRYVIRTLLPDFDDVDEVQGYYVFVTDISDRHNAEVSLQNSTTELQSLFAAMDDVVLVISEDGSYLKAIETNSTQLYRPPAELTGKSTADIFEGEQLTFFQACIQQTLKAGTTQHFEYSLPIKGIETWFNASCSPLPNNRLLWMARDVSDRHRMEEALRDSELRYLSLVSAVPVGIFRLDLQGSVVYANHRVLDIYDLSYEAFCGEGWQKTIHPDDLVSAIRVWKRGYLGHVPTQSEYRFIQSDGSVHWVYVQTIPERNTKGNLIGTIGTIIEITDRKEAEARIRQSQNRLLEAQRIAHIGSWEFEIETERLTWSAELHRMYGRDPAQ
ncbi:MAG: PAS domain S-box protein, partial [Limnothrix sp.]